MLNTQRRPTETQESLDLPGGKATLAVPGTWHRAYSDIDRVNVAKLIEWLNHTGKSQAWLCRLSRINPGTANQVLKGTYTAPPAKFIAQMSEAIKLHEERRGKRDVPFVETSVTKLAAAVCHRARVYRNFALLVAYVGTGKTEALKQIAIANAATYMVEADPDMGPGAMLEALVTATKAEVETRGKYSQGTTAEKFRGLVKAAVRHIRPDHRGRGRDHPAARAALPAAAARQGRHRHRTGRHPAPVRAHQAGARPVRSDPIPRRILARDGEHHHP